MSTINLTIDGVACTCERGEFLYDVAKRNGIDIPVLCRSNAFEDHRACCRICIVEVEIRGRVKVVTSCVYPVEQDCIVRTNTDRIREERAVVMALLLKRAPESETMRSMANKLGAGDGFERLVTLDGEKCILCGLCVQACDSLGTGAISTVDRGCEKRVDTPYSDPSLDCVGCLSCANVCPTGAIAYTQTDSERTIWNRTFKLVRCPSCGRLMGTEEAVAAAAEKAHVDAPRVCDECRKKTIADSMMHAYRYV